MESRPRFAPRRRPNGAGKSFLYELPWYAIIGPPGVGKTTALRHSRAHLPPTATAPFAEWEATRNCDWWFTSEAILLDTAGRYATDTDDREEWLAFLDLLRAYRVEKPLNGLIVAVALPDVMDADEGETQRPWAPSCGNASTRS